MAKVKISGLGRPGFVQDIADYDMTPEAWNEVRNVRFNPKGAVSFGGHSPVLAPASIVPLWLRVFPPIQNPIWVYGGQTKIFAFNNGHTDITRLSGDYGGTLNERWQGEVFQGLGIFNNVIDIPQLWERFDASVRLVDLPNWPGDLRAKFVRSHKNFLFTGYTIEAGNERPYRIRWSHPAAPGTIPASWALNDPTRDSGEKDIAETSDYIVDGLGLGDFFILYKQRSFYTMQYVGRPDIWGHWTTSPSKGLLWRDCVTAFPGGHFVVGIDDIYTHTGQKGSERSIVEASLRDWVFNQIDVNNYFNCYVVNYERRNEIWFCFPEVGEVYPTIALVWNRITGGVGIRDIPSSPFIYPGPVDLSISGGDVWDNLTLPTPPVLSGEFATPINLTNHTIRVSGLTLTGADQPQIFISLLGGTVFNPDAFGLGRLGIFMGTGNHLYIDGEEDLDGFFLPENEWWGTTGNDPIESDYEVHLTVLSGESPNTGLADTYTLMDEAIFGLQVELADTEDSYSAVWRISIHDTNNLSTIYAQADFTILLDHND